MTVQLHALCFAAAEPSRLVRFWSALLGWEAADAVTLRPPDETGFRIRFETTGEPKSGPNRAHFDLTSTSLADQRQTVARALELGARHIDVGQLPEEGHVVLADPEGNEFCVIEPGNNFLAGCGFIGALAGDGTREVGCFWSAALGWPLVWDQDEETAIRAPHGGPKITWGGPPLMPRPGRDRVRFDLVPAAGEDRRAAIDRLISLGATRIDTGRSEPGRSEPGRSEPGRVAMADPDGSEFSVSAPVR